MKRVLEIIGLICVIPIVLFGAGVMEIYYRSQERKGGGCFR